MKKLRILIILLLASTMAYADICPSLQWSDFGPSQMITSPKGISANIHTLQKDFLIRNKVEVLDPPMYADEDINPSNIADSPSLVMVRWDSITQEISCEYAYVTSSMFIPLGSVATIQHNIAKPVNSNLEEEIKWFDTQENYTLNGISTGYHLVSICEGVHGETPISPQVCSWE